MRRILSGPSTLWEKKFSEAQLAAAMRVRSYPNFVVIEPTLQEYRPTSGL